MDCGWLGAPSRVIGFAGESAYVLVCRNDRKAGNDVCRVLTREPKRKVVDSASCVSERLG